ncbi:MAG TPA: CheR family methyltransferase [Ramlibacter sp.]|nr:CheR family methyltransferase [Ramlibacter sp.]
MTPPATLELLAERIAAELGLHFPPERAADLCRGLAGAARDFGVADGAACANGLLAMPWTQAQVRILASHLTVGETYFLRDKPLLNVFAGHMLPELLSRRRALGQRRLHIWSAGCCTGEEPYSLAILVEQALPDLAEWDVRIVGTDVNPRFLEKARAGRYNEWSFRGVPAAWRQRYFERTADGLYRVCDSVRSLVSFAELNMAQDTYPRATNGTSDVDVIFCRNLLMYFDSKQVAKVAERLRESLQVGGWLIVSPTEAAATAFPGLEPVNFEAAVAFRKQATRCVDVPQQHPELPLAMQATETQLEPSRPMQVAVRASMPMAAFRQTACTLADQGRLDEALTWCDRWVAADKLDPWGHYVRGVVLIEQGDASGARQALRRCVYLQPGFVLAHLALGQLARGLGHEAETARHFHVAEQLLGVLQPGEALADAQGLTAGRLHESFKVLATAEGRP